MPHVQLDDTDLFPRANRRPNPAEEAAVKRILAEEEEDLVRLNVSIKEKQKNLDRAQEDVSLLKERMLEVKMRQAVIIQLRDGLQNGLEIIRGMDILGEETNFAAQKSKEKGEDENTINCSRKLKNLLQSRETTISGILKQIEDAESLIARQAETLAIAYEELQTSLFVKRISQETLDSTVSQSLQVVASIQSKKNVLRPIWRLPHEIWNQIFHETAYRPLSQAEDIDWNKFLKICRQPLILSAVCYQWRSICRADPRLWKDPVLYIQDDDDYPSNFDFQTYCALTAGIFDTLTIVTHEAPESLSSHSLREHLSHIKALNITCTNALLTFDSPMPVLEELNIDLQDGHYFPNLISVIRQSGTNLRKLYFAGVLEPDEGSPTTTTRTTLAKLREISMSCQNLLEYFVPNFVCPSLQKISFLMSGMPGEMNWDSFFAQGDLATTIEDVDIGSMRLDVVQNIILPFLDKLRNLNTLTLQGESVEPILQAGISIMTDVPDDDVYSSLYLSTLETLRIKSYTGTGELVLQYVEALQGLPRNDANEENYLKRVIFRYCPHVTYDVKSRLAGLHPDD
ncbi:hypothetical protein M408DRAFT_317541 [Serendipita vermifera MAFF 305830]|uniref:Uncharacterized protein n=1 Tax=Serendipita vermifera MAFF 305830 TaxID=933852 RepID=A0A0C3AX30_SERVB|nr:hypothetical protein M408DRAFT_317541 [Serendipita vermifera MAFF 305830]